MDKDRIPKSKGIARIIKAFFYSLQGLLFALKKEAAVRQEIFFILIFSILGWYLVENIAEFFFLLASLLLVLVVELLNTSIEKIVDLLHPKIHPLAKAIKDMASAAVLISLIIAVLVWVAILAF